MNAFYAQFGVLIKILNLFQASFIIYLFIGKDFNNLIAWNIGL